MTVSCTSRYQVQLIQQRFRGTWLDFSDDKNIGRQQRRSNQSDQRRNPVEATYKIHGHDLSIIKTGKYLGVIISEDLSWKSYVIRGCDNSLTFLLMMLRMLKSMQFYTTLALPILKYAAPVWDLHTTACIQQFEAVQRRAARFIKGEVLQTRR